MVENITCSCCGKSKRVTDYYKTSSPFHAATGVVSVCKVCIFDHVKPYSDGLYDLHTVKSALRMIDRPLLEDIWNSSIEECKDTKKEVFKIYMKNIAMTQYRDLDFSDSTVSDTLLSLNERTDSEANKVDLSEARSKFGKGLTQEEYVWLTNEYIDWTNRYEIDTKAMETLITEICLTSLDIKKRRSKGEKVDTQMKTLQDLLGSSNLKPVQETGAMANIESFGTLIKKYENEHPIPEPLEQFKDVDRISSYIKVFFTGHLMRMLGKKDPDLEKEYWEEMEKLTVLREENEDDDNGELL